MRSLRKHLIVLACLTLASCAVHGAEDEEGSENTIDAPSPDGKFAFRYVTDAATDSEAEADDDAGVKKERCELIDKKSGKAIMTVAKSDPDLGPSARFNIEGVLWRADSSA